MSGFLFGIFLRHQINLGWSFLIIIIFLIPFLSHPRLSELGSESHDNKRDPEINSGSQRWLVLVVIGFLVFGYTRLHISLNNIKDFHLGYETFTGTIIDEPDSRENSTYYIVSLNEIDAKARITLGQYPILNYGDAIELRGKFEQPKNFKNPKNGIEFDYKNFL